MKLVQINWIDAVTDNHGWRPLADIRAMKPSACKSVGWIVKQTKAAITIVSCLGEGDCDGDITIPMGMVKQIIPLGPKR